MGGLTATDRQKKPFFGIKTAYRANDMDIKINGETIELDGYIVADIRDGLPPSIRANLETLVEPERNMNVCDDCGGVYIAGTRDL